MEDYPNIPAQKIPAKRSIFVLAALLVLLMIAGAAYINWKNSVPKVEITFFEAGQGDSFLIRTSDRKVVLVDGSYPNGRVLAALNELNVRHIDLVIVTHAHDDHTGGIAQVLRAIPVDRLITNGTTLDTPVFAKFEEAIRESGVKEEVVKEGDQLKFGRLTLEVLAPRSATAQAVNNNSIVTRLVVGKYRFLFMGDAMKEEEQFLMQSGAPLYAQFLKVGHHTADTSSSPEFIQRVNPKIAIYMAETGNIHGFPHQVTLDTLKSLGAKIYGTEVNGTITVQTDGKTYTIHIQRGEPR